MKSLLGLATLAFCISSFTVGLRMARLALRTHRLPETVFAVALLCAGVVGYGSAALASSGFTRVPLVQVPTIAVAMIGVALGASGVAVFTWRVFRPSSRAAAAVVLFGVALTALSVGMGIATGHGDARDLREPWFWVGFAPRALSYAWSGVESLRYARLMRRRAVLGLAAADEVRRFERWGIAASAAFGMHVPVVFDALRGSPTPGMEPGSAAVAAALGMLAAGSLWRAFWGGGVPARAAAGSAGQPG